MVGDYLGSAGRKITVWYRSNNKIVVSKDPVDTHHDLALKSKIASNNTNADVYEQAYSTGWVRVGLGLFYTAGRADMIISCDRRLSKQRMIDIAWDVWMHLENRTPLRKILWSVEVDGSSTRAQASGEVALDE